MYDSNRGHVFPLATVSIYCLMHMPSPVPQVCLTKGPCPLAQPIQGAHAHPFGAPCWLIDEGGGPSPCRRRGRRGRRAALGLLPGLERPGE